MDSIHFPPINREDAFGFVDPNDVLHVTLCLTSQKGGDTQMELVSPTVPRIRTTIIATTLGGGFHCHNLH